jgi:hypothetical protein
MVEHPLAGASAAAREKRLAEQAMVARQAAAGEVAVLRAENAEMRERLALLESRSFSGQRDLDQLTGAQLGQQRAAADRAARFWGQFPDHVGTYPGVAAQVADRRVHGQPGGMALDGAPLWRAQTKGQSSQQTVTRYPGRPVCGGGHVNPPEAVYCGMCGERLRTLD